MRGLFAKMNGRQNSTIKTQKGQYYRNNKQELSYHKQIARQLHTSYVEGIYKPNYSVTLKSRLRVTQGHWKRNHWVDHTRLTSIIVTLKCGSEGTQGHWKRYHLKACVRFPIHLPLRRYSASKNDLTLKSGFGVVQSHWKWHGLIYRVWLSIGPPL